MEGNDRKETFTDTVKGKEMQCLTVNIAQITG